MNPDPAGRPLHGRILKLWRRLSPGKRKALELGAEAAAISAFRWGWKRLFAVSVATAAVSVSGAALLQDSAPGPIKRAWLQSAGGVKVERVAVPCIGQRVDLGKPAAGVGHTVEGSFESGLAVFRQRYAPHFLVGRDRAGKVRILQFCPLGEMTAALKNRAGGVETNRWARAQVELAAFSSRTAWAPDPAVMRAFAALLYELRGAAGIPLRRGGDNTRSPLRWGRIAGWYNHAEIPENDHWDMGAFRWADALKRAASFAPVVNPGHAPVEPKTAPPPLYRVCYWKRGLAKPACSDVRYYSVRRLNAPPGAASVVEQGPVPVPG
jgi:hypothetical protein